MRILPQNRHKFHTTCLIATEYIEVTSAKFRHIMTVQKFYSDFLVVFRMLSNFRAYMSATICRIAPNTSVEEVAP